jgi:hypothetical protein
LVPSTLFSVDFMMEAKRNKPMWHFASLLWPGFQEAGEWRNWGGLKTVLSNSSPGMKRRATGNNSDKLVTNRGEERGWDPAAVSPLASGCQPSVLLGIICPHQNSSWHFISNLMVLKGGGTLRRQLGHQGSTLMNKLMSLWDRAHRSKSSFAEFSELPWKQML